MPLLRPLFLLTLFSKQKEGGDDRLDARDGVWLLKLGLGEGAGGQDLILRLDDGHVVGEGPLGSDLALRVPRQHNLDPIREKT